MAPKGFKPFSFDKLIGIEGVSIISYLNAIQGAFLNIRDKTLHYNSIV